MISYKMVPVTPHYIFNTFTAMGILMETLPASASFEVFTAVMFQVKVFWVMMPCSVVVGYHHFRGPCCLCFEGEGARMGENGIDIGLNWRGVAGAASQ
jgi:hypothetical protein